MSNTTKELVLLSHPYTPRSALLLSRAGRAPSLTRLIHIISNYANILGTLLKFMSWKPLCLIYISGSLFCASSSTLPMFSADYTQLGTLETASTKKKGKQFITNQWLRGIFCSSICVILHFSFLLNSCMAAMQAGG